MGYLFPHVVNKVCLCLLQRRHLDPYVARRDLFADLAILEEGLDAIAAMLQSPPSQLCPATVLEAKQQQFTPLSPGAVLVNVAGTKYTVGEFASLWQARLRRELVLIVTPSL